MEENYQFKTHIISGSVQEEAMRYLTDLRTGELLRLALVQFSSVAQSCPTLCSLMDCSMPGFPVLRYLLEFAETHVH